MLHHSGGEVAMAGPWVDAGITGRGLPLVPLSPSLDFLPSSSVVFTLLLLLVLYLSVQG